MSDIIQLSLAAIRTQAKMTQQEWAEALGVSCSTVKNWESGKGEPKLSDAVKMAKISGIPLTNFFNGKQSHHMVVTEASEDVCES